jgi:hypothetical protein
MNIFYTSDDPKACAVALDDKRLVKMVLETAQILSTITHKLGCDTPYKPTHMNHPCVLWAGQSLANFSWLKIHGVELAETYTRRYGREHKSEPIIRGFISYSIFSYDYHSTRTPHPNCTPYKSLPIIEAYKQTLRDKWNSDVYPPNWTIDGPPTWR